MPLGQQTSSTTRYSTVHTYPLEVHLQHATGAADQQYQQVKYSPHLPSGGTSPVCHWGSRPAVLPGTVQYTLTIWRYISSMPLGQQTSSTSSRYSTVHTYPLEVHLQHATGAADQQYHQVQYSTHLPSGGTSPACHWGSRPAEPAGQQCSGSKGTGSLRTYHTIGTNQDRLKGQCHEIFDFRFFHESVSPKPLSIH